MRAIAVHEDVVVAIGAIWKTTCTAVRAGDEAFLIDSPILPEELEALPALLEQAGFAVSGLLVTHADWDHLLGRYAFPEASIGCGETTAARLAAEPGAAQRELREFDEQYLIDRPARCRCRACRRCRCRATARSASASWSCTRPTATPPTAPRSGSRGRGCSCAATTSRPARSRSCRRPRSLDGYLATLRRLEPLVEQADDVVPGHGEPLDSVRAAAILREDLAYVEALAARPGVRRRSRSPAATAATASCTSTTSSLLGG